MASTYQSCPVNGSPEHSSTSGFSSGARDDEYTGSSDVDHSSDQYQPGSNQGTANSDWVVKPSQLDTSAASTYKWEFPLVYKLNWIPLLLLALYTAATGAYIYYRITTVGELGPYAWYGSLILAVELLGVTAMLPYGLLNIHGHYPRKPGSTGLPPANRSADENKAVRFNLHVIVPCYREKLDMVQCTVIAAMTADLPAGANRTVYLCDDGKDPEKRDWAATLADRGLVYVTGRTRVPGEINGKSNNMNNCLKNWIYPGETATPDGWRSIPHEDLVVVFDADMIAEPHFFTRLLEVMWDDSVDLALSPQCFHNTELSSDLYNNINMHFWEQWIPAADAWGVIVCTGTNYAVRARALAEVGWFPTYTVGEDYALGMELKQAGKKGAYLAEKLAAGESPIAHRDVLRQRSRWAKGHMQVFFSVENCPLLRWKLPFVYRLWYSYATWCYFVNILLVPVFAAVPLVSVALQVHPVLLDWRFAMFASVQYGSILLLQSYAHNWTQLKSIWFSQISNTVLWAAYTKAVVNTVLANIGLRKQAYFKVTPKSSAVPSSKTASAARLRTLPDTPAGSSAQLVLLGAPSGDSATLRKMDSTGAMSLTADSRNNSSACLPDDLIRSQDESGAALRRPQDTAMMPTVSQPKTATDSRPNSTSPLPADPTEKKPADAPACEVPKGILDPTSMFLLMLAGIATIGFSIYKTAQWKPAHPADSIYLWAPYLFIPMMWGFINLVPALLFFVYYFSQGAAFKWTCKMVRPLMTVAAVASFVLCWLSLPAEVDVSGAQARALGFMTAQKPPQNLQDLALIFNSTNGTVVDMSGGWLPSGSPSKPLLPIAYATHTLAWALASFPNGFPSGAARAEALDNVQTGADYILRSYDPASSRLIVQVGNPSLYTFTGQPSSSSGKLWTSLAADPTRGKTSRLAWAFNPAMVGADASGSAAAALAAAATVFAKEDLAYSQRLLLAATQLYGAATSWEGAKRSYCRVPGTAGNGSSICTVSSLEVFTAMALEVKELPEVRGAAETVDAAANSSGSSSLAGQVQCWVPEYEAATCSAKMTLEGCLQQRSLGQPVFQRRAECCQDLSRNGRYNETFSSLQGVCRLPDQQLHCFVANARTGSCARQELDIITGTGCAGSTFSSEESCCNQLALSGALNGTNGTCADLLADKSAYCYVPDVAARTCTMPAAGELCQAAGADNSFSDITPCCSRLEQLGVERGNMTGICSATAAALPVRCYSPNATAKTCDVIQSAERCAALWASQGKLNAANASVFDSQQLCCSALAASVGSASTTGICTMAAAAVNTTSTIDHFRSSSVFDDLALAAVWLYRATSDAKYLSAAQQHLQQHWDYEVTERLVAQPSYYIANWDNSAWAAMALLLELPVELPAAANYRRLLREFMRGWKDGRTPRLMSASWADPVEELLALRRMAVQSDKLQLAESSEPEVQLLRDRSTNKTFLVPLAPQCIPDINATAATLLASGAATARPGEFLAKYKQWEDSCTDGIDNDCDGLTDLDDPDCGFRPVLQTKDLLAWTPHEPLPNAAGAAVVALSLARSQAGAMRHSERGHLRCWALTQVQYMLGSSGRSYVVGMGKGAPQRPQHMASACPVAGNATCTWANSFYSAAPNPEMGLVAGALVAGPDVRDVYVDDRSSEGAAVGVHYNAAFVGALAGLLDAGASAESCMKLYAVYPGQ